MHKVVNDAHVIIDINPGEFYPIADKDMVVGEDDSKIQGNPEEQRHEYAGNKPRGKPGLAHLLALG